MEDKDSDFHVVEAIVALSQKLRISVIAEGIETIQQLKGLQQLGCEYGQGYLFSRPLPAEALTELLEQADFTIMAGAKGEAAMPFTLPLNKW